MLTLRRRLEGIALLSFGFVGMGLILLGVSWICTR